MYTIGVSFKDTLEMFKHKVVGKNIVEYLGKIVVGEGKHYNIAELISMENENFKTPYIDLLGGDVWMITHFRDLDLIKIGSKSLLEGPLSFDVCEYVDDTRDVVIYYTTNNSGGPSFFIPENLCTSHVVDSINLSKEF